MAEESKVRSLVTGGGKTSGGPAMGAGSGSGSSGGGITHDVVSRMIDQSEQKIEAKFSTLQESIDHKLSKLDNVPGLWQIVYSVSGIVATGIGIAFAILSFTGDRIDSAFTAGTTVGDKFAENRIAIEDNKRRDEETRNNINRILNRLDNVVTRLDGDAKTK